MSCSFCLDSCFWGKDLYRVGYHSSGLLLVLLVLGVVFENYLLDNFSAGLASTLSGIVGKTIAAKFVYDKRLIAKELNRHGVQTILCAPQDLSVQTINKYMEIKAKGLI